MLELFAVKSRAERLNEQPHLPHIPWSRMPRLLEVFNRERVYLGLTPIKIPE